MRTLIGFLLLCMGLEATAAQTSEWQVTLTRGSSNTFVQLLKASTREAAESACAAAIPQSASPSITYTCNAARRVFVVTPSIVSCPAAPAPRQVNCPAGTTGTWTQTATVGPAPSCTVTWTPAQPPQGACTPVVANSKLLSWTPPAQNTDGTPLTTLAGYYIYWGNRSGEWVNSVRLAVPGASAYRVTNLTAGTTYYFAVRAYTTDDAQSDLSNIVGPVSL